MKMSKVVGFFIQGSSVVIGLVWFAVIVYGFRFPSSVGVSDWFVVATFADLLLLAGYGAYRRQSPMGTFSWARIITAGTFVLLLISAYLLTQVLAVKA